MAAWAEPQSVEIINLRQLNGGDLAPLLHEEVAVWRRRLHWDYSSSAQLIQRYVDIHALSGFAIWTGNQIAGYCYYVIEDHKALIGDLFLLDSVATPELEHRLLESVFNEIVTQTSAARVESQLMMLRWPPDTERLSRRFPTLTMDGFRRHLMVADLQNIAAIAPRTLPYTVDLSRWTDNSGEDAAALIANCYSGHIDSSINDQYLNVTGTRKFLTNIVLYPGCGRFFEEASILARDKDSGNLVGLSMASIVAPEIGHITQLCIDPAVQGSGIGYELIRHSLVTLADHGCREASLTVTAENHSAINLYHQMGFRIMRDFSAYIWKRDRSYN